MAGQNLGEFNTNFTNCQDIDDVSRGSSSRDWPASYGEVEDIQTVDAALKAYDAFTYSDAELQKMNANDKLFAYRNCKMPKTISDYAAAQTARTA